MGATIGHAEHSGDLRKLIEGGKEIIISTVRNSRSSSTRSVTSAALSGECSSWSTHGVQYEAMR